MKVYTDANIATTNQWNNATATYTDAYYSEYTYDKNGNLQTLKRNGDLSTSSYAMDNFAYNYTGGTNRLDYVNDAAGGTINTLYTDDINSGQSAGNYGYDKLGQLTKDTQEGITSGSIVWRYVDKKLKSQKNANNQLEFIYNPLGQRVVKIVKKVTSGFVNSQTDSYSWDYTYYAYDANGQVMATYQVNMNTSASLQTAKLDEHMLYGADRLGVINAGKTLYNNGYVALDGPKYTNQLGKKNYELKNYLGNVNAVITDRKMVSQTTQLYTLNTFTSSVEGWTGTSGTLSHDAPNQQLKMAQTGTTGYVSKTFTTIAGEDYMVAITATNGTTGGLSTTIDGTTYSLISGVTNYFRFTAATTSSQISIKPTSGTGVLLYYVQDVLIKQRTKYDAVEVMRTDYYPFGMAEHGRTWNNGDYRYGYNGMEVDPELKGNGNSYTTEFRQYDPRLGRWLSLDPMASSAAGWSPYRAFFDNPVFYNDPSGLFETRKEARESRKAAIADGWTVSYTKKDKNGQYYYRKKYSDQGFSANAVTVYEDKAQVAEAKKPEPKLGLLGLPVAAVEVSTMTNSAIAAATKPNPLLLYGTRASLLLAPLAFSGDSGPKPKIIGEIEEFNIVQIRDYVQFQPKPGVKLSPKEKEVLISANKLAYRRTGAKTDVYMLTAKVTGRYYESKSCKVVPNGTNIELKKNEIYKFGITQLGDGRYTAKEKMYLTQTTLLEDLPRDVARAFEKILILSYAFGAFNNQVEVLEKRGLPTFGGKPIGNNKYF